MNRAYSLTPTNCSPIRHLAWATDGRPDGLIEAAHRWAKDTMPLHDEMSIVCGDPRFASAVFDKTGVLEGSDVISYQPARI